MKLGVIYKVTNHTKCLVYIGKDQQYADKMTHFLEGRIKAPYSPRLRRHESDLISGCHKTKRMQDDYAAGDEFTFEILDKVPLNLLVRQENFRIQYYHATNPLYGYNDSAYAIA